MLNVAMFGASGRMGRTIIPLVVASTDLRLSGALAAAEDAHIGHDAGVVAGTAPVAVSITSDPERALEGADVAIDFTLPASSAPGIYKLVTSISTGYGTAQDTTEFQVD